MKRLFSILIPLLFSAGIFAQTLDTLDYPVTNASGFTMPGGPGLKYFSGSNIQTTEVGQIHSHPNGTVQSVVFWVGDLEIVGTPDNFQFNVYDVSAGLPTGAPLATETVSASALNSGLNFADGYNVVSFTNPPSITGDFAITITTDLGSKNDTIGIVANDSLDGGGLGRSITRATAANGGAWFALDNFWVYNWDRDMVFYPIVEQAANTLSLDLAEVRCGNYTSYPLSQVQPITFGGFAENTGSVDVQVVSASIVVTELNGNTQVYNPTIPSLNGLVPPILAGAEERIDVPSFLASYTPTDTGVYEVEVVLEYGVSPYTSGDPTQTTTNSYFFLVDDSVYARDEFLLFGQNFNSVGTGISDGSGIGQAFNVASTDTLTSVTFAYNPDSSIWVGENLQVNIYNYSASGPGSLVTSSSTFTIPDDSARFVTVDFASNSIATAGEYFVAVNNAPRVGYSDRIVANEDVFVQLGNGGPWALLDTLTGGQFPGSFMIRPNFGTQAQAQQPPSTCDTLVNIDLVNDTLTIYGSTLGGAISGHSGDGFTRFAEKFTSPYANSEINNVSLAFGSAQTNNPGTASITVNLWDDDGGTDAFGVANAPGTVLASQSVLISDIVTDVNNNDLTTITFGTTPVVSGDFYVGFEVTYANGDSVALITNQDESIPATFNVGFPTVWGRIDSVYGTNISGFVLADICESTTQPAPVVNFSGEPLTLLEGNDVQFTDLSTNTPTTWAWNFQGGAPGSSANQNPLITYNTAGTYDVSLDVSNAGGSDAGTATDFVTVLKWPSLPTCDTISNIDFASNNLLNAPSTSAGYVTGHNNFGDLSKADKFSGLTSGDEITGVALGFAVAEFANGSSSIDVNVWDNTGVAGGPGSILATESVTISSIATDISNNTLTYVTLANPVTVAAATDYYIGISFTYAAGDSVALYHSADGEAADSIAWEEWSTGDWFPYSDAANSWGLSVSHLITPLVCTTTSCPTIGTNVTTTDASCGASDGTTTVTPSGGDAPYTYEWNDNSSQTTQTATGLAAGNYQVTVEDANGCTATATANVSDSGSPTVTLDSKGNASCNGASDGFISVVVSGGTPGYTYNWSSGGNTATETGLVAGTYTLTVEDANGCSETFSETISEPTALSVSVVSTTDLSCASVNDGEIDIDTTGGTPPYTYTWSNNATTQDVSSLAVGTYTVTVEDVNGCTATTSATISNPANPLTVTVANAQTSACGSNDATLTANANGGAGNYTYAWTGSLSGASVNGLGIGNYSVTVTDGSGCTATASANVSDPGALTASVAATAVSCNGQNDGQATASVSGGSGSESYAWSSGGSGATVTGLAPGQISVTVTDAGCSAVASATVTEPSAINVSVTQTNVTCNGGSNGAATAFVTGGAGNYSYEWLTVPIQITQSITGEEAGQIILNVEDGNGCAAAPVTVTLTQPTDISAAINTTPVTCYGDDDGAVQLTVSGGSAPYSYNWDAGGSSSLLSGVEVGTYSVTVSDINNCDKVLSANVTGPDSISIQTGTIRNVSCNGLSDGSISLNVSGGNGGFNYEWSNAQSTASPSISNLNAGNYFVTATDANGCVKVSNSISVSQPAPLTLTSSFENVTCAQGSDGSASVDVNGGTAPYTYNWSSSSNSDSLETGLTAGPISVTVTDDSLCTNSASINISDGASPTVSTTSTDASASNDDGTATADVTGGAAPYSYEWDDANGQTTATATGLEQGTYNVTVTDDNGCTATASVVVDRNVSVASITDLKNLQLYPNPTSGTINLKLELGSSAKVQVEWVNVLGAQVAAEYIGNTLTVNRSYDLGAFSAGIYFAKIRIDDELIVRKVIVSKQ